MGCSQARGPACAPFPPRTTTLATFPDLGWERFKQQELRMSGDRSTRCKFHGGRLAHENSSCRHVIIHARSATTIRAAIKVLQQNECHDEDQLVCRQSHTETEIAASIVASERTERRVRARRVAWTRETGSTEENAAVR